MNTTTSIASATYENIVKRNDLCVNDLNFEVVGMLCIDRGMSEHEVAELFHTDVEEVHFERTLAQMQRWGCKDMRAKAAFELAGVEQPRKQVVTESEGINLLLNAVFG